MKLPIQEIDNMKNAVQEIDNLTREIINFANHLKALGYKPAEILCVKEFGEIIKQKKMIKLAKYAYFDGDCWFDAKGYYKDDASFSRAYNEYEVFQRLERTEIEVEDY